MGTIFLLPVYTFLLLYYKNLILNFLYEIFAEENEEEVQRRIAAGTGGDPELYVWIADRGLIVASLNTMALLILGVPYAVLWVCLGRLLNVLPFYRRNSGGVAADDGGDDH